jgi:hypothetical protein
MCPLLLGLTLNLNYGKVLGLSPTIVTQLVCNLAATLSVDHRKALNNFTSNLPLDEAPETPNREDVLESVNVMQYLLEAQKIAVELLANICTGDGMLSLQCNEKYLKLFELLSFKRNNKYILLDTDDTFTIYIYVYICILMGFCL